MTSPTPLRRRLAQPPASFLAALLFASVVVLVLRIAWHPSIDSYLEYTPIGAVFAAFLWDRLLPDTPGSAWLLFVDAAAVALALMRVIVPPLPFVSGHGLLVMYAALTARRWPLRAIAVVVLTHVVYTKVFASGGWRSMLGGFAVAGALAIVRGHAGAQGLAKSA
jgi:hypothetical protein